MGIRALLVSVLVTVPLSAQFENPEEKIRELAQQVAEEMQEIDRLLLRTGGGAAASEGIKKAVEGMEKLLEQTTESQGSVVKKIDALIQEILKVQSQSQSQSQSQQQQRQKQRQQQQQQQQQRTKRQRSEQQEQNTEQQDGEDREQNQQNRRDKGENKAAKQQREDPTAATKPGTDNERWGDLQLYEEFLKSRGGAPKVPDKYRRYHEAYLKQGRKTKGSSGGRR